MRTVFSIVPLFCRSGTAARRCDGKDPGPATAQRCLRHRPATGLVALLQQRLQSRGYDYEVINASITGDTTRGGLSRLPAALEREHPGTDHCTRWQ